MCHDFFLGSSDRGLGATGALLTRDRLAFRSRNASRAGWRSRSVRSRHTWRDRSRKTLNPSSHFRSYWFSSEWGLGRCPAAALAARRPRVWPEGGGPSTACGGSGCGAGQREVGPEAAGRRAAGGRGDWRPTWAAAPREQPWSHGEWWRAAGASAPLGRSNSMGRLGSSAEVWEKWPWAGPVCMHKCLELFNIHLTMLVSVCRKK